MSGGSNFGTGRSRLNIDVTLDSLDMIRKMRGYMVLDKESMSPHKYIVSEVMDVGEHRSRCSY